MIIIISCFIVSLIFLAISHTYIDTKTYEKYPMLFFILNSAAVMLAVITGSYLFMVFMIMGELYV
jgi:hypothetical protein